MTDTNTAAVLEGLAAKLLALELSDAEAAVLDELVGRAASVGSDVEGFSGVVFVGGWRSSGDQYATGEGTRALADKLALGVGLDPNGVWTDMRPLS